MRIATILAAAVLCAAFCRHTAAQDTTQRDAGLEQRFRRMDRDGDGRVTQQELPRPALFRRLDRDGDGAITREELPGYGAGAVPGAAAEAAVRTALNLPYGEHDAQRLDVYAPAEAKLAPVMVYVHGGGWERGDKGAVGRKVEFFTGMGWVFVSVNYRLLPEGAHPANVRDVAQALARVHDHICEHGGDRDRLFVMGHSAGCHLAALVATDRRRLETVGKSVRILKGVIALDTNTYDLPTLMQSRAAAFYGQIFAEDPATWRDASPVTHIVADGGIPPFLVCYSRGMRATVNPARRTQAEAFGTALRAAGISADVIDASDRSHGEINAWFGNPDDSVTQSALAFLERLVKPAARLPEGGTHQGGGRDTRWTGKGSDNADGAGPAAGPPRPGAH